LETTARYTHVATNVQAEIKVMTRAAIYARYSSEHQSETSIEDQVRNCRRLCEEKGWQVVEVYADRALSGASTLRPGYQKLMADARRDKFEVVVSPKGSTDCRASRSRQRRCSSNCPLSA
jgi:predicted site-specific integrase-resolvase